MIKLSSIPTTPPDSLEKKATKKLTAEIAKEIALYQEKLFAEGKKSLLIVFQGMDSSGKDGSTREVFKYCTPVGLNAIGFGKTY